ncbi:MAG: signal peptidase I [Clostridiales Family XIII bacterium]|jgi:signal peptidase I|nr:signal peptidase I [Clostridiales Family XIII bacterium]
MKEWIRDILIAVAVALLIMQFIKPTIVKEHSMEPTLYENNYIFLSKQQYRFSDIKHGQIVVFHSNLESEDGKEKLLIKRVIAVPGDELEITGGAVYLNGEMLKEDYIKEQYTIGYVGDMMIPEGKVFVMGDNRQNSFDSRNPDVGLVSEDKIIGMAFLRVFPFNQFGLLGRTQEARGGEASSA